MKRLNKAHYILCFILSTSALLAQKPFLGAYLVPSKDPKGLEIITQPGAPADKAGLLDGDVIIEYEGKTFQGNDKTWRQELVDYMNTNKKVGSFITLKIDRVERTQKLSIDGLEEKREFPLLDLPDLVKEAKPDKRIKFDVSIKRLVFQKKVRLGKRSKTELVDIDALSDKVFRPTKSMVELQKDIENFIKSQNIKKDCDDLDIRLQRVASKKEALRPVRLLLDDITRGHRFVEELGRAAQNTRPDSLVCLLKDLCHQEAQAYRHHRLSAFRPQRYKDMTSLLVAIEDSLSQSHERFARALSPLSPKEQQYVAENVPLLTESFSKRNYIDKEPNGRYRKKILKVIELGNKLDLSQLLHSFRPLLWLTEKRHLKKIATICGKSNLPLEKMTKFGPIIVAGKGRHWHKKEAAVVIDLAGNDFYSLPKSKDPLKHPFQVIVDLSGDDYYQSPDEHVQGSGCLGHGLLVDREGNDTYIGTRWAQGTGIFGCGLLADLEGNDTYRGRTFCQSCAIFGLGILRDYKGNDRYEGHLKCQAFAGARSAAFLVDDYGSDNYYSTGETATGYGTPGIFDSWSQGCADGFRQLSPGGIAAIIDCAGDDRYEAGNFSQGGGYYYGAGFILDKSGNDLYLGSRYNQGFCAHQAVGLFIDEQGDDTYRTHQGVAQGLAWDESATLFIDSRGNDRYEGGTFFSQGTSAHNSKCFFWDKQGKDTYIYPKGQGLAGDNSYHGGTSLTLFIDDGSADDVYSKGRKNNDRTLAGKHGVFIDR